MRFRGGLHILFVFFLVLITVATGALGWRMLEQDRALARQRKVEQLDAAADRLAGALFRKLTELEAIARRGDAPSLPAGTVRVRLGPGISVWPKDALVYLPWLPPPSEVPSAIFGASETAEFRARDPRAAVRALAGPLASDDARIRAEALVRAARNWRKAGEPEEALRSYGQLAALGGTILDGLPAELVALDSRCALLRELGRKEWTGEAQTLLRYLTAGRWQLPQSAYVFYRDQTARWLGKEPGTTALRETMSAALQVAWRTNEREPSQGGRMVVAGSPPVIALWEGQTDVVFVLTVASEVERWLVQPGGFCAGLFDGKGNLVLGSAGAAVNVERTPVATRLPWTLRVSSMDDGTADLAGRQWLLIGGFTALIALVAATGLALTRAVSREMELVKIQRDFVAAVSHEFRSPLSSIAQMAELLEEDRWPSEEHRRRGIAVLNRESGRLRRLVETLLDFAAIEAGTAGWRRAPVAAGDWIRGVVDEFQRMSAGASVEMRMPQQLPVVTGDWESLRRALWNLLENAVKYSPPQAHVAVEVAVLAGSLSVTVRDEGIGIPLEEQGMIFDKFFRGAQAREQGYKGTGLGLAMVRHIMECHGGAVKVESKPGCGSAFTLILPLAGAEEAR